MNPNIPLTEELVDRIVQFAWDGRSAEPDVTLALCQAWKRQNGLIDRLARERDLALADVVACRRAMVAYLL